MPALEPVRRPSYSDVTSCKARDIWNHTSTRPALPRGVAALALERDKTLYWRQKLTGGSRNKYRAAIGTRVRQHPVALAHRSKQGDGKTYNGERKPETARGTSNKGQILLNISRYPRRFCTLKRFSLAGFLV